MLLELPDFKNRTYMQLVSRERNMDSLFLHHSLCTFRFFVESSIAYCGVVDELCTDPDGTFRHRFLCTQGDNLRFVVVIRCLSLWKNDCFGFLHLESTGSFNSLHVNSVVALVEHLSLTVELDACCFEDSMISVVMRSFLSEFLLIYKSLSQHQDVQSVGICLCFLSYDIAYEDIFQVIKEVKAPKGSKPRQEQESRDEFQEPITSISSTYRSLLGNIVSTPISIDIKAVKARKRPKCL